jgi:hypothetical protein
MRSQTIPVIEGSKSGMVVIGPLIYDVSNHEFYLTTPASYLRHGRLRECYCDCGNTVLYSENVLSSGQVKSCGCLRKTLRLQAHALREQKETLLAEKMRINTELKIKQAELRRILSSPNRTNKESQLRETQVAAEIRNLITAKGHVTRKLKYVCQPK